MKHLFTIIIISLCIYSVAGQANQFQENWLDNPRENKANLLQQFDLKEIEEFDYQLPDDAVLLENGYAKYTVQNPEDWEQLKEEIIPTDIFIIYTKYPKRKEDWRTNYHDLLANRLKELFTIDPTLNSTKIKWTILLQTNCNSEKEAKRLFHGIVIYYKPIVNDEVTPTTNVVTEHEIDTITDPLTQEDETESSSITETVAINTNELGKTNKQRLVEQMKSELPEELKKQATSEQQITKLYLESIPANKPQDITPAFKADRKQQLERFMEYYGDRNEDMEKMLDRQDIWNNSLVVMDWTGSMYSHGAEVMLWHLMNFEASGIRHFVFFNDGNDKNTSEKKVGETGGIYMQDAQNIDQLLGLFKYVMSQGGGGDIPENDLEAIIKGIEKYPEIEQVVLIADNNSCVRDLALLSKITKPIKVILCGYTDFSGANPQYLQIAIQSGGSIHTTEQDLTNLALEMLDETGDIELRNNNDEFLMMVRKSCERMHWYKSSSRRAVTVKNRQLEEPEYEKKIYYSITSALEQVDSAYRLSLADQDLVEIPKTITGLEHLKAIDASYNELENLPKNFNEMENLQELDLSHNKIRKLPADLNKLTKLSRIEINNNDLKTVPTEVADIVTLQVLNLSHNELRKLPKRIKTLTSLEEFDISYNQLSKLPVDLGQLRSIRILNFEHNQIEAFPTWVGNWRQLRYLDLSHNKIEVFPGSLKNARNLQVLDASHNNIQKSVVFVTTLKKLTFLNLSYNNINKISSSFGNLEELEELDMSHNQLISVSYRISRLKKLKQLKLNDNNLKKLPKEIVTLRQLRLLDISNNKITDAEYERLKKLMPWCVIKR